MKQAKSFSWPVTSLVLVGIVLGGAAVGAVQTQNEVQTGQTGQTSQTQPRDYEASAGSEDATPQVYLDTSTPETTAESSESYGYYSYQSHTDVNGHQSGTHQEWAHGPETNGNWQQVRNDQW